MEPAGLGRRAQGRRRADRRRASRRVGEVRLVDEVDRLYRGAGPRRRATSPSWRSGASPRAGAMLAGAARARAALDGRDFVIPDDVKALAPALLRHRVILSPAAEINGRKVEEIVLGDHRGDRGAALIYPTRTAVIATAAGAPVALAVAARPAGPLVCRRSPGRSPLLLLFVFDALRGAPRRRRRGSTSRASLCRRDVRDVHGDRRRCGSRPRKRVGGAAGFAAGRASRTTAGRACRSTTAAARSAAAGDGAPRHRAVRAALAALDRAARPCLAAEAAVDARRRRSRSCPTSGRCTTRARASSSATRSRA